MNTNWQTWILDTIADIDAGNQHTYMEDTCDDIVSQKLATIWEINAFLISIDQEPMYS